MSAIVGRGEELEALDRLLDDALDGPVALTLTGEAGIGKSIVWDVGRERAAARGFHLLLCRPVTSELYLTYAGLGDLLAEVDAAVIGRLPVPLRAALDAALLRSEAVGELEPRAVAAGFLAVLDELASDTPVLLAIDDLQWLDEPTLRIVEFATRRCTGQIAVLVAQRVDDAADESIDLGPASPTRRSRRHLDPLSLGAIQRILTQVGRPLQRPALVRIADAAAGNPFFAIELARSVDAAHGDFTTLPQSLQLVMRGRLDGLPRDALEALAAASLMAYRRIEILDRALPGGDVVATLAPAEEAGLITFADGVVRFAHPLLAHAASSELTVTARRRLHRQLGAATDDVEERARHLALGAVTADDETIAALDDAAASARGRGAPETAAELLEQAVALGAAAPERLVRAADDHYRAANQHRAGQLLEKALPALTSGPVRARALRRLGVLRWQQGRPEAVQEAIELLEEAHAEAADDLGLRAATALELCWALRGVGRLGDCQRAAALAVDDAERFGDHGLLAEAVAVRELIRFLRGDGVDEAALHRAVDLHEPSRQTPLHSQPLYVVARIESQLHRFTEATEALTAVMRICTDRGAESDIWLLEFWFLRVALETGDVGAAEELANHYRERAQLADTPHRRGFCLLAAARVDAWVGRVDAARAGIAAALDHYAEPIAATHRLFVAESITIVEMSTGNLEAVAAAPLVEALHATIAEGHGEPAAFQVVADVIEALMLLGRAEEAEPLMAWLEASASRPDRPWARAAAARCRGVALAAVGDGGRAAEAFADARAAHDEIPQARYDRARTLLAEGRAERRRGHRQAARTALTEALELFEALGMRRWVENASDEIDRLGTQPGDTGELTATERRVAELAASGMSNREIAAALYASPKTVEAHLGRAYRKLGIRRRTELAKALAAPDG